MNNISPQVKYLIEDINSLRLFKVEKVGHAFVIEKITISRNDQFEKIENLIQTINEGRVWVKHGHRKTGNVKYAGKGVDLSEVQSIILKKRDKNDETQTIDIDITKEHLEDQIEEMSEQDISLLEKIGKALKNIFEKDRQAKEDATNHASLIVSSKSATHKIKKQVEQQPVVQTKNSKNTIKQKERSLSKEDEKSNEKAREKKHKQLEISQELDQKADTLRHKDIRSDEKRQDLLSEDFSKKNKKPKR